LSACSEDPDIRWCGVLQASEFMTAFNRIVFEKNRIFIFAGETVGYISMTGEGILLFVVT
jgi:hypothetical protein